MQAVCGAGRQRVVFVDVLSPSGPGVQRNSGTSLHPKVIALREDHQIGRVFGGRLHPW